MSILMSFLTFDSNDEFHPFEIIDTSWLTSQFAKNLFKLLELDGTIETEVIKVGVLYIHIFIYSIYSFTFSTSKGFICSFDIL